MINLPAVLHPHIKIEEINSLTEQETDMLLYICNVWAPIRPPMPTEGNPHPITLTLIRATNRHAIIDRVIQACVVIKDNGKEIYNSLRTKLGIPNPPEQKAELNNGPVTGSNA